MKGSPTLEVMLFLYIVLSFCFVDFVVPLPEDKFPFNPVPLEKCVACSGIIDLRLEISMFWVSLNISWRELSTPLSWVLPLGPFDLPVGGLYAVFTLLELLFLCTMTDYF